MSFITVTGVLTNPSGAVLPNYNILFEAIRTSDTVINNTDVLIVTNSSGGYSFELGYGTYTLKIKSGREARYSTVASNILIYSTGLNNSSIQQIILAQDGLENINIELIDQFLQIRADVLLNAQNASTSETNAAASAASALTSKNAAAASATSASSSAATATTKASEAASSATSASSSAATATTKASEAAASATTASSSATTATTKATEAAASATSATTKATEAAASATSASSSATTATTKATEAAASATTATTKATNAATSEANALASKNAAATSATNAATSEANALASKNAAATSATSASSSATTATTKATEAATSATSASSSAATATTKATEAAASAASALTSKNAAATSETNAAASAASALASKNAAATSETNAAASAATASTSATSALASKTAAATSETNAAASAAAASTSEQQAAIYAASLAGGIVENGGVDLSSGVAPTPMPDGIGGYTSTLWKVTVGGTVNAVNYAVGDSIVYSKALGSYYKIDSTDQVSSVNGMSGAVNITSITGNAGSATILQTARTIATSGDVTGTATSFNGSANITIPLTLVSTGVAAGTYKSVTVDAKGRVTSGSNPTTLAGYGITDAQPLDAELTAFAGLSTNGIVVKTAAGTATTRSVAVTGTGLSITNADGVAGNPTITSNATNLNTVSTIVARDASGNFSAGTITAALSGNASTATKLATARTINGVAFDGTANITIADATKQPLDSTLTALVNLTTAADKLPYFSDVDTVALTAFPTFARSLVGCSTQEAVKILLDAGGYGNFIGTPGTQGFGVGICPLLPVGFLPLSGTYDVTSDDYGNYQYSDGSICVWIPAFYARIGHPSNPTYATYGVNSVDIKPYSYFVDIAAANAAGYFLPRCFIDGSTIKAGFFIDKYMCSNNGGIASSIKNGNPLSSAADNNPFSGLTGAPSNTYVGVWSAAKTRGAAFFVTSRFMYAALALLSLAHGQAAISATNCAWYDATGVTNFPKGCNNGALKDTNDTTVTYTSGGYSNCGKTGSGVPFAKTTHNGQACGIADLNGLMWEISQGVTCIATSKTITAATQANPVKLTMAAHGMTTGQYLQVTSIVGMTQLNDKIYKVTVVDANNVTLNGVDGTAFTAYTSGGSATYGTFYVAKESAVMANFTSGNTLATDHFGAVGVAANMDVFTPAFATTYASNGFAKKLGNSANQVLSPDLSGNNAVLRSLGIPIAAGMSTSGSNLFGQDYLYQYIRNELCLLSGAGWDNGSGAGVWASDWRDSRLSSSSTVGFRSASYL